MKPSYSSSKKDNSTSDKLVGLSNLTLETLELLTHDKLSSINNYDENNGQIISKKVLNLIVPCKQSQTEERKTFRRVVKNFANIAKECS